MKFLRDKIVDSEYDTHYNLKLGKLGNYQWSKRDFNWRLTVEFPSVLLGIAENIVWILTLGYLNPHWRLSFLFKATRRKQGFKS